MLSPQLPHLEPTFKSLHHRRVVPMKYVGVPDRRVREAPALFLFRCHGIISGAVAQSKSNSPIHTRVDGRTSSPLAERSAARNTALCFSGISTSRGGMGAWRHRADARPTLRCWRIVSRFLPSPPSISFSRAHGFGCRCDVPARRCRQHARHDCRFCR